MSVGSGFSPLGPGVMTFEASPDELFTASAGGAATSGGGENADCAESVAPIASMTMTAHWAVDAPSGTARKGFLGGSKPRWIVFMEDISSRAAGGRDPR